MQPDIPAWLASVLAVGLQAFPRDVVPAVGGQAALSRLRCARVRRVHRGGRRAFLLTQTGLAPESRLRWDRCILQNSTVWVHPLLRVWGLAPGVSLGDSSPGPPRFGACSSVLVRPSATGPPCRPGLSYWSRSRPRRRTGSSGRRSPGALLPASRWSRSRPAAARRARPGCWRWGPWES